MVWLVAQVALFALSRYVEQLSEPLFTLLQPALAFALHLLGALMAFFVLQRIAEKCHWQQSCVFTFLSRNSMTVYLLHQQVVFVSIYFLNGLLNPYFHAAVNLVAALAVSLVLSAALRKYRVTRFLVGEG